MVVQKWFILQRIQQTRTDRELIKKDTCFVCFKVNEHNRVFHKRLVRCIDLTLSARKKLIMRYLMTHLDLPEQFNGSLRFLKI